METPIYFVDLPWKLNRFMFLGHLCILSMSPCVRWYISYRNIIREIYVLPCAAAARGETNYLVQDTPLILLQI